MIKHMEEPKLLLTLNIIDLETLTLEELDNWFNLIKTEYIPKAKEMNKGHLTVNYHKHY